MTKTGVEILLNFLRYNRRTQLRNDLKKQNRGEISSILTDLKSFKKKLELDKSLKENLKLKSHPFLWVSCNLFEIPGEICGRLAYPSDMIFLIEATPDREIVKFFKNALREAEEKTRGKGGAFGLGYLIMKKQLYGPILTGKPAYKKGVKDEDMVRLIKYFFDEKDPQEAVSIFEKHKSHCSYRSFSYINNDTDKDVLLALNFRKIVNKSIGKFQFRVGFGRSTRRHFFFFIGGISEEERSKILDFLKSDFTLIHGRDPSSCFSEGDWEVLTDTAFPNVLYAYDRVYSNKPHNSLTLYLLPYKFN